MSAEPAFDADFTRNGCHLIGKRGKRSCHVVDGFRECRNFALGVYGQLLREIPVGHRCYDLDDAAHLFREVCSHHVYVVGKIFPGSSNARDQCLSTQFAFGTDIARHARNLACERVQLVHHRVDGVLQFQNFTFHIDRDLARQVAFRNRRRHLGDVANLSGQVPGHRVYGIRKVFPSSGDAGHVGLASQSAFAAHFARHTGHFRSEGT